MQENTKETVPQNEEEAVEKKHLKIHFGKKESVIVCTVAAIVCLFTAGYLVYDFYREEAASEQKMEELRQLSEIAEPIQTPMSTPIPTPVPTVAPTATPEVVLADNPYADIFAQNADMVAWLSIEGTKIDYPVMQTMEDENYYLERDFEGNYDKAGCLILDTESSLYGEVSTNQIIHGHNMKAGTMFGGLKLYEEEDYGKEHSRIQLFTKDMERNYEVIAVFYSQVFYATDLVFKYYNFFQADTEEQFQYFYDNIKKMSLYDTGVEAEFGDRFLTLSTCSYQVEDGRFVVVAKEVEPGDTYRIIKR